MELKDLIEKITREVMDKIELKEESPTPQPIPNIPPEISKRITPVNQQVVETSNQLPCGSEPLLLVEDFVAADQLLEWLNGYSGSLKIAGSYQVKEKLSGLIFRYEFISVERIEDLRKLENHAGNLVYPLTSIFDLARLAGLLNDTPLARYLLAGLEKGDKITVLKLYRTISSGLNLKELELIKDLKNLGIELKEQLTPQIPQSRSEITATSPIQPENHSGYCNASQGGECGACGLCAALIPNKVNAIIDAGANRLSAGPGAKGTRTDLAQMIDHTILKPDATKDQIINLCREAREYNFFSVCINPTFVKLAAEALKGSPVKVCTVVGFPLGATTTTTKVMETRDAIANGAHEIDMVINVGALKAGNYELVKKDIEGVIQASEGRIVKVILETALLTDEEKIKACELAKEAGADFVKTSTGFGPGGATAHDIALMRKTVGKYMGVKASGGIRDFETARQMIEAGATRIGASASVAIVKA